MHPEFEKVKSSFSAEQLDLARERTWKALHAIAKSLEVGMLEADARVHAEKVLKDHGAQRFWHKTHVRFGVNTLKTFSETSLPGVRLQERDIFFLDIGPVFDGYEGDAGESFVIGQDPEMKKAASDSRRLFDLVREEWMRSDISGNALYQYAVKTASEWGWNFKLEGASGHRISDFPHALYHKGSMQKVDFRPSAQRWVLEIALHHPTRPFGAFYEDVLF